MSIDLELYKVFYHAARAGSISKAAQELFISQPAVSQSIKLLENRLGGQLFFRTPKGITLTPEGEVLFKYIEQGYNFIMLAESKFSEMQNLMSGEIKIGASDMALRYYLLPYLEAFHTMYPKVKIKVSNGPTPETIRSLKKGLIDFGVISLPIAEDPYITVKEALYVQDCFVAGEKYKELSFRPISLKELSQYPILALEKDTSTRRFIDKFASSHGVLITPEIELATSDLLVQFAKRGLGISCVVRNFAEEELEKGELYEINLVEKIPQRKLGLATLKNVPLSASASKFLGLIKDGDIPQQPGIN